MAKMTVGPGGIEIVQGALTRPKKVDGHKHGLYLVATHRTAPTTNPECQRVYSFKADRYQSSKAVTANAVAAKARFSAVARAVNARKSDLMQINQDKQAFLAQRDTAGGKTTMKAYLWKVCGDAYDAEHPRS